MANMQSWLNADPLIGDGNGTVKVTAEAYDGRLARSSDINFVSEDTEESAAITVTRKVTQSGRPAFVTINTTAPSVPSAGQTLAIMISSNCEALKMDVSGNAVISMGKFTVSGEQVDIGSPIPGDPGATGAFSATVSVIIPKNTLPKMMTYTFTVRGMFDSSTTEVESLLITQMPGARVLTVTPDTVELGYDGSDEGTFNVTSNDSWMVD